MAKELSLTLTVYNKVSKRVDLIIYGLEEKQILKRVSNAVLFVKYEKNGAGAGVLSYLCQGPNASKEPTSLQQPSHLVMLTLGD